MNHCHIASIGNENYPVQHNSRDYDTEVYTVTLYWRVIFRRDYKKKYFQDKESSWKSDMMMMEDTRRQVAMGDMVHDMLIDRPPSPARMEYRSEPGFLNVSYKNSLSV